MTNPNQPDETYIDLPSIQPTVAGRRLKILMQNRLGRSVGRSVINFDGGEKPDDPAGPYSFWSVVAGGTFLFSARTSPGRTVLNRLTDFDHMHPTAVFDMYLRADHIRPSEDDEIKGWLREHPGDAAHIVPEERVRWGL